MVKDNGTLEGLLSGLRPDVARILDRALEEREITMEEAVTLFGVTGRELFGLMLVADELRHRAAHSKAHRASCVNTGLSPRSRPTTNRSTSPKFPNFLRKHCRPAGSMPRTIPNGTSTSTTSLCPRNARRQRHTDGGGIHRTVREPVDSMPPHCCATRRSSASSTATARNGA